MLESSNDQRRLQWKAATCAVVLSLAVTGCASQATTGGSKTDQANANANTTVAEGALTGAAVGALAGGLLSHKNPAAGAVIGAAAGGLIGAGAGKLVANNNAAQARTEDSLQAQIDDAHRQADHYEEVAASDRQLAARAKANAAALQVKLQAGQITMAAYRSQASSTTADLQQMQRNLEGVRAEEAKVRKELRANGGDPHLQADLVRLQNSEKEMLRNIDTMSTAESSVPSI